MITLKVGLFSICFKYASVRLLSFWLIDWATLEYIFCFQRLVDQERKVVFRQYRRWIDDLFDGYDVSDEGHFKVAIEENVDDDWYGPTLGYVHPRVFSSLDFLPFQCLKPSFTIKNKDDLAMFRISRSNCNATLKFDITDVNNGSLVIKL